MSGTSPHLLSLVTGIAYEALVRATFVVKRLMISFKSHQAPHYTATMKYVPASAKKIVFLTQSFYRLFNDTHCLAYLD